MVILAEPLRKEFSLTDSQLGALGGFVFGIPYSLMLIPVGMLVDRVNRRNLLAVALSLWSVFTLITGFARNLPTLIATRALIAAAESVNSPASLSLLSDHFDKRDRSSAVGIFYAGPALAAVCGFTLIGIVAESFGWRAAFFCAGVPGLLMAGLFALTVREPVREGSRGIESSERAIRLRDALRFIYSQSSLRHFMLAMMVTATVTAGQTAWMVPLLMRVHGFSLVHAATTVSLAFGLPLTVGQLTGGFVVDSFARRNLVWIGRITAGCALFASAAMIGSALSSTAGLAIALLVLWALSVGCLYGPAIGTIQNLSPPRMRGVSNACLNILVNLVGAGIGPLLVGAVSDGLKRWGGVHGLAWALAGLGTLEIWAWAHFQAVSRQLAEDLKRSVDETARDLAANA